MASIDVALPILDVNHAVMTGERFKRVLESEAAI
jgi:hypothetical protein